jgi:hypothetical protein
MLRTTKSATTAAGAGKKAAAREAEEDRSLKENKSLLPNLRPSQEKCVKDEKPHEIWMAALQGVSSPSPEEKA